MTTDQVDTIDCPRCDGTGRLTVTHCIARTTTGRRCSLPPRQMIDPEYARRYGGALADYPPNFMAYCGLHGNALKRAATWHRRNDDA